MARTHEKLHMEFKGAGRKGALGGQNTHVCPEATEGMILFRELRHGSSLSRVQGGGIVTDDTGQVIMKERPLKQQKGI